MKYLLLLSFVTFACSARLNLNRPLNIWEFLRERSLYDDFKDIKALIPERKMAELFRRYFENDSEFQGIIYYLRSPDVYRAIELIRREPEIKEFELWLQGQITYDNLHSLSDETDSAESYRMIGKSSALQKSSSGWRGFMTEFLRIYPWKEIRNLIRDKVAANGPFTMFWNKITALRPVYERILKYDEIKKVVRKLRELGVDTSQLDKFIRKDFGWKKENNKQLE